MTYKLREIIQEVQIIVEGRSNLIDSIAPPLIFVALNAIFGLNEAIWGSLAFAMIIAIIRLIRGEPLSYVFGGLIAVTAAIIVARWLGSAEGYFLPGIIEGAFLSLACLVSIIVKRPLVAWTSHIARGWPREWYWHPKVRPAYSEVTFIWMIFFFLRSIFRINLYWDGSTWELGIISIITGWPATIVLLVLSYVYGSWRLRRLNGPSVEEFEQGAEAPWESQTRGF